MTISTAQDISDYDWRLTTEQRLAAQEEFAVAVNKHTAKSVIHFEQIEQQLAEIQRKLVEVSHHVDLLQAEHMAPVHGREDRDRLKVIEMALKLDDDELSDHSRRLVELEAVAALEERQPNDAYIQMHGQRLAEIERRLAALEAATAPAIAT